MSFTSITQRFVIWFLAISLLPILLIGYSLLQTFEQELRQTAAQQILAIADKKADQIEGYLEERMDEAVAKTQSNVVHQAVLAFTQAFDQGGVESDAYRRLDSRYRDYFKRAITRADYYDLFLISPQGTVVYSQTHEADFATNLFTGPYRNTGLAEVARNALSTLESNLSEFELYAPSGNAVAAFVAAPIMIQGKVAGVLALQIDSAHVFRVLLDDTGLGVSGETLVARREDERTALAVAPLKSEPDAALKRKILLNDARRSAPLVRALNGEHGSGFGIDYLDKSVVAAWSYLPIMKSGMVVKMDTAEALAPLYRVRTFGLAVVGLALVGAFLGALLLGRRVVAPLKGLSGSAREIAAGKLDQRVPVVGRDELAYLATSFNIMAERLQSSYANLEDLVKQRTAELTQSLERLHIKDAAIASSINAIVIASLDGKISYVNPAFVDLWRLQGPEDALGHSLVEFWVEPEQAQAMMEVLQQQGHWQGELPARLHDGGQAVMQLSASRVVDEAGQPFCMMSSFMDITERKRMEALLSEQEALVRKAQETAHIGNFKFNPATNVVEGSDELFRIFGISRSEFLFSNFADAVHPDQRDFVVSAIKFALRGKTGYDIEHALLMRDGTQKQVRAVGEVVLDGDGSVKFLIGTVQDITVRKQMELSLRQERDFASSLVNTASMIVLLLDTQGSIEYVNPHFEQLTGYRLDEVKGKDWFRAFLPERDQDNIRSLFQESTHEVPIRGNINPILTRSGEELEIEWYCEAMRDTQGKVVSVLATGQDVTARRVMERALSASTERLREAQRIAQVGSWELDLVKGELIWSDEIFRLFEIDKSQFGATYEAFLDAIHPDDRDVVNQAYTRSLETRTPYEITHRLHMVDGRIKWIHERCETIFDDAGKPLRSMGTVQDITERMQSEVEYQTILKTTMECFWICDLQGRLLDVNDAYCELIGYSREELLAMSISDVEALESADDTRAHIEKVITMGGDRFETLHRRKDGNLLNLEVSANFMLDGGGKIVVFLRDISLRKLEEKALIESRRAAEAANRAKSEFLANMSHEIRTPMNAILGLTQLVLDTELPQRQQDFLQKAHGSAQALLGILNDILDFSKIEAGRMSVEQVPFSLEETLEQVADLFSARIEEKGLKLFFEVAPGVPAEILSDPLRLAQVLTNLVGNAVKFTEHGEIHVKVEVSESSPTTQQLRFAVSDTGIGLSKAQAERLFQPFTQADGTTTRKYGGTGLGLAICKKMVELMGGDIYASGVEGQGSTFVFTIQAGVAPSSSKAQPPAQAGAHSDALELPQSLHGARILLVEDNALNRLMAAEFLKRRGVVLTQANHGGEAVEQVKGATFDAVLMDIHMPIMDGLKATRLIRELPRGKSLPIIAMTAAVLQEDRDRCAAAGMVDFIAKPIDPEDMVRVLLKWVNAGRSKQVPFRVCCSASAEYNHGEDPCDLTFASSPLGERIEVRDVLPPSLPGFDLEKALQRLDGNRGLLARLLLGFAGEQSDALAQLDALVQAGDSAQAVILLHTLKGVAANLGAEALAEATRQLEEELKSGHAPVSRQSFADALNAALEAIKIHVVPVPSTAGEHAVNRDDLAQVLNRLVPYLQEQELVPAELMESLYGLVRSNGSDKILARLMHQVDSFDHDGALASVVQLAAIHGVTLANEGA